jgi:hypothetical protein
MGHPWNLVPRRSGKFGPGATAGLLGAPIDAEAFEKTDIFLKN